MATLAAAVFAWALLGIALISRIPIWALRAWKKKSFPRLILAHLITFGLLGMGYALATAEGGTPQWQASFTSFVMPSLIVFVLDAIVIAARRNADRPASDALLWFLHADGKQSGPLTTAAIQAALAEGSVKSSDWIWRSEFKEWVQIETVDLAKAAEEPVRSEGKTDAEQRSLLRRWRGWSDLPASYWVGGLVIAALFALPYLVLVNLDFAHHPQLVSTGLIVLWLAVVAAMLWLGIGVFRSADHYATAHPKQYWSAAAKGTATLAGLVVLGVFLRQGVPEIRNSAGVISEVTAPRYALKLLRGGTELELAGPMHLGLGDALAAKLKEHPSIVTLHLNSEGGRASESDQLAELVLARKLNTYVPTSCVGECATVFAAGANRWLSRNAMLALHQPGGETEDLEARTARTKAFLQSRGIAVKFIDRALASTAPSAWRPSHAELFTSGFATSYATDAEVAVAGIPMREIEEAEKGLDSIGLYQVIASKHPEAHAEIHAILRNGYVRGQSTAAMRQRIWAVILPIVNKGLSSASDSALVSFYRIALDEAQVFERKDAPSCEAFLKGRSEGFDPGLIPPALQERELLAFAEVIGSSGSYGSKSIDKAEAGAALARLLPEVQAAGFSSADLQQAIQFKLDPARNCRGMILFLHSLLKLDDPSRTAVLRFMAQQSGT
jgi:hypothetical protein